MRRLLHLLFFVSASCLILPGCSPREESSAQAAESSIQADPEELDSTDWIALYEPKKAWNGYTLAFYRQRTPILIDMNGRIVHSWPEARAKSRLRLLDDCSLLVIGLGRYVAQYDWEGNLSWQHDLVDAFPHHDVIRLESGNTLLVIQSHTDNTDHLVEVDASGDVIWDWHAPEHLARFIEAKGLTKGDLSHINSVQELPPNRLFDDGDARFRPGNLLISARSLDAIFVIDKQTDKVVWSYDTDLDRQHEALMLDPDWPGGGNIQLFNNRYRSFYGDRQSEVLEIDPATTKVTWRYRSPGFYSPTSALEQPLPNGNVLVASSRGGRVFEVARSGETVWEWTPPFEPVRPQRYSYDHCPRLADLARPEERQIAADDGYSYIDKDVYRFARRGSRQEILIGDEKRVVLENKTDCRDLILPRHATAQLAYGVDRQQLEEAEESNWSAHFKLSLRSESDAAESVIFEDRIDPSGPAWRQNSVTLDSFALQQVKLCVDAELVGPDGEKLPADHAYWAQPGISAGSSTAVIGSETDDNLEGLSPEELEVRKRHLETLGYIN